MMTFECKAANTMAFRHFMGLNLETGFHIEYSMLQSTNFKRKENWAPKVFVCTMLLILCDDRSLKRFNEQRYVV